MSSKSIVNKLNSLGNNIGIVVYKSTKKIEEEERTKSRFEGIKLERITDDEGNFNFVMERRVGVEERILIA